MEKMPPEWIDKIFEYMSSFFKESWLAPLELPGRLNITKSQWQTGLIGLTKDEIKKGLAICKCMAKADQQPPNVVEFYFYSKGLRLPPVPRNKNIILTDRELAKKSIDQLKKVARGFL